MTTPRHPSPRHPSPCRLRRAAVALLLAASAVAGGCALSAPPARSVLGAAGAGDGARAELDALAEAALQRSEAAPADAALAASASALLFQAADLRLQQESLRLLDAGAAADAGAVLAVDDRIQDPARTEILSLCTTGRACAERALLQRPGDVGALLHQGLHLSLIAWANGPARSLFAGYGGKLVAAIDAAVAAEAEYDHGAPLRLLGRFRSKAPWPYGDAAAADAALRRAVALAPIAVNQLFLGDARWYAGDREGARAAWTAATTADGDESTRWSNDLLRELARRRLAATADGER